MNNTISFVIVWPMVFLYDHSMLINIKLHKLFLYLMHRKYNWISYYFINISFRFIIKKKNVFIFGNDMTMLDDSY